MARTADALQRRKDRLRIETGHPNLKKCGYRISSQRDGSVNCIAFAADVDFEWWWPALGEDGVYWPSGAPLEVSIEAFIKAFETLGYSECDNSDLEPGFEKVAIYADKLSNKPRHMAWQTPRGKWKSKLGRLEDITHSTLNALEEGSYGVVVKMLRRRRITRVSK